jgi:hypothetical protein
MSSFPKHISEDGSSFLVISSFSKGDIMKQEHSFTLTLPLKDLDKVEPLLTEAREMHPKLRISRKPDRGDNARFYLSFPFSSSRPDLSFQEWFSERQEDEWDLFGPNYGRWGLC